LIEEIGSDMDIKRFITLRPHLYHLTDRNNFKNLLHNGGVLFSTTDLVQKSSLTEEKQLEFIKKRRPIHEKLTVNGQLIYIRDQRPISIINLQKCIPADWSIEDYIRLLNERVFFWSTLNRLDSHYKRYSSEKPVIIKVETESLLGLNTHPEFCRLNSGATRSNENYDGGPPPRGRDTFLRAEEYPYTPSSVAEVTFPSLCCLPKLIQIGKIPFGPWKRLSFAK
jgi:hypothetical protein